MTPLSQNKPLLCHFTNDGRFATGNELNDRRSCGTGSQVRTRENGDDTTEGIYLCEVEPEI